MTKHHRPRNASTAFKIALAAGCCAAVVGTGGAIAYLTDTQSVKNPFTVVSALDITLLEPAWSAQPDKDGDGIPDSAEAIVPLQTIAKDPLVENTAGTEAWVFMTVAVPTYDVQVCSKDGVTISQKQAHELFDYTVSEGWRELGEAAYDEASHATVHVYAWERPVKPEERTDALFSEVTLINLADNQLDAFASEGLFATAIDVDAHGIQTEGFSGYEEAWKAYSGQRGA